MRTIRVLDTAPLVRRGVVVLELDTPSPLLGVNRIKSVGTSSTAFASLSADIVVQVVPPS